MVIKIPISSSQLHIHKYHALQLTNLRPQALPKSIEITLLLIYYIFIFILFK